MKNVGLEQRTASNRLSSGYRINSAADDAAGLAISETMRAQIRGLDQASRNAQDGQAMLLTTEGGLEEIGNMLQRVRELTVQSANDTNTQDQRAMIEQELSQLSSEIQSMQQRVEFNTNRVLAMGPAMDSEINNNMARLETNSAIITEAFNRLDSNRELITEAREILNRVAGGTHLNSLNAREQAVIRDALGTVDMATVTSDLGLTFQSTISGQGISAMPSNITAATVNGTNTATELLGLLSDRLTELQNTTTSLNQIRTNMMMAANNVFTSIASFRGATSTGNNVAFFQVGANAGQGITYDFEQVSRAITAASAIANVTSIMTANPGSGGGIGRGVEISPLLSNIQGALDDVASVRANLGAVQNRMDYTMRSLDVSSENLQDSESRVRNADMAREMMRFTMSNVLQQASMSMLSQANQMPNNLLQVLR